MCKKKNKTAFSAGYYYNWNTSAVTEFYLFEGVVGEVIHGDERGFTSTQRK